MISLSCKHMFVCAFTIVFETKVSFLMNNKNNFLSIDNYLSVIV